MTKYKVLKEFRDKNTQAIHPIDSIYETDSKSRVEELKGFIGPEIKETSILDQKVETVLASLDGLPSEKLEEYLGQEKNGRNRKTVVEHISALLKVLNGEEYESGEVK
ncbi:hypothetical protein [Metabacillus fastidiosus]|uniref:hypothetical protein n=1 Tax=Metabacillus fastidiosus TaxID=1458 RepID=UPI003D2AE706